MLKYGFSIILSWKKFGQMSKSRHDDYGKFNLFQDSNSKSSFCGLQQTLGRLGLHKTWKNMKNPTHNIKLSFKYEKLIKIINNLDYETTR